jgi:hypothetical protein
MRQRVNQKLEEADGTQPGRPSDDVAGPPQEPLEQPRGPAVEVTGEGPTGAEGFQVPSSQQIEQMRQRFENMSDEERQKEIEKMRQGFESMSPEEQEKMRQRFQGRRPRQRAGPEEAGGPRRAGRPRPQGPEGDQ